MKKNIPEDSQVQRLLPRLRVSQHLALPKEKKSGRHSRTTDGKRTPMTSSALLVLIYCTYNDRLEIVLQAYRNIFFRPLRLILRNWIAVVFPFRHYRAAWLWHAGVI